MWSTVRLAKNKKYIEVAACSNMTSEIATRGQYEALKLAKQHNLNGILVDVRSVRNEMTPFDDVQFADDSAKSPESVPFKIAILRAPDDESHDFIETAGSNRGLTFKIFTDEDEAITWVS